MGALRPKQEGGKIALSLFGEVSVAPDVVLGT